MQRPKFHDWLQLYSAGGRLNDGVTHLRRRHNGIRRHHAIGILLSDFRDKQRTSECFRVHLICCVALVEALRRQLKCTALESLKCTSFMMHPLGRRYAVPADYCRQVDVELIVLLIVFSNI